MLTDAEFQQEKLIPRDAQGIAKIATYDQFFEVGEKLEVHLGRRKDVRGSAQHGAAVRSIVSHMAQFQANSTLPVLVSFDLHKLIFSYYLKSKKQSHARLFSIPADPSEIADFYKRLRLSGKLDDPYWLKSFFVSFSPALSSLASKDLFVEMVEGDVEAIGNLWSLEEPRISDALAQAYFKIENGKATGISEPFAPPPGISLKGGEALLSCRFKTESLDRKFLQTAPDFLSMVPPELWEENALNLVLDNFPFEDIDSFDLKKRISAISMTYPGAGESDVNRPEPLLSWLRRGTQLSDIEIMPLIDQVNGDLQLTQLLVMIALPSLVNSTTLNKNWKLLTDDPRTKDSLLKLANVSNGGLDGDYIANKIPYIYKESIPPIELASLYEKKSKLGSVEVDQRKHERFALKLLQSNNVDFVRAAMESALKGDNYDFCKSYFKAYIANRGLDDYARVFSSLLPIDLLRQIAVETPRLAYWISNDILRKNGAFYPGTISFKQLVAAEIDGDILESWALVRERDSDMSSLLSLIILTERNVSSQPSSDFSLNFRLDF